jgi:hypothetical protein
VRQGQRLQPVAPVVAGIAFGLALFFVGKAVKDHFAVNAAICNTFNGTTARCAGDEFAYDMGGVVQYLAVLLGIVGILGGFGLSVSRKQMRPPVARTSPPSGVSHAPTAGLPARPGPADPAAEPAGDR